MPRTQTSGTKTGSVDWLLFSFTLFCKEKQIYRSYHIRSQIYWVLISYQYLQTGKGSSSSELISENNWVATESNIHSNSVSFMFNFCYYNWKKSACNIYKKQAFIPEESRRHQPNLTSSACPSLIPHYTDIKAFCSSKYHRQLCIDRRTHKGILLWNILTVFRVLERDNLSLWMTRGYN